MNLTPQDDRLLGAMGIAPFVAPERYRVAKAAKLSAQALAYDAALDVIGEVGQERDHALWLASQSDSARLTMEKDYRRAKQELVEARHEIADMRRKSRFWLALCLVLALALGWTLFQYRLLDAERQSLETTVYEQARLAPALELRVKGAQAAQAASDRLVRDLGDQLTVAAQRIQACEFGEGR